MKTGIPAARAGETNRLLVVDFDRDDRHATGRDPERDPIPDRAQPGDDDVVVDVPGRSGGRASGGAASGSARR